MVKNAKQKSKKEPEKQKETKPQTKEGVLIRKANLVEYGSRFSTNIPQLDAITGGGILQGRIYELFGTEGVGKSTLAEYLANAFLSSGSHNRVVLRIESEFSFDLLRCRYMGGDTERIKIAETNIVEDGFEAIGKTVDENKPGDVFAIWDTVASADTRAEVVGGKNAGGLQDRARMVRAWLRDNIGKISTTKTTILFVNQVYDRIGATGGGHGTPGGRGIKFHACLRINLQKIKRMTKTVGGMEAEYAAIVNALAVKNKLSLPRVGCPLFMHYERGFLVNESIAEFLKQQKMAIPMSGGWFKFEYLGREIKFQSGKQLNDVIDEDPVISSVLRYVIISKYAQMSPLAKVRLIDIIWELEGILGIDKTVLADGELFAAAAVKKAVDAIEDADK